MADPKGAESHSGQQKYLEWVFVNTNICSKYFFILWDENKKINIIFVCVKIFQLQSKAFWVSISKSLFKYLFCLIFSKFILSFYTLFELESYKYFIVFQFTYKLNISHFELYV